MITHAIFRAALERHRHVGDRAIQLMNGTTHTSSVYLAYVDPVWHIAP